MKKLVFFLTLIGGTLVQAQNVPLYSIDAFSDELYVYDTLTWTASPTVLNLTSSTGIVDGCTGMAVQPCSGDIYVVYKSGGSRYLGILDTAAANITEVGEMDGENISAITFGAYDLLYAVSGDGSLTPETLFTVDLSNGGLTLVSALGNGDDGEVISFCNDNGYIYHWSGIGSGNIFEKVNPTTTVVTPIPITGYDFSEISAATYIGNGKFLIAEFSDIMIIDTNGVSTSPITTIVTSSKGFAFPLRYIQNLDNASICAGDTATLIATQGDAYDWFLDGVSTGFATQSIDATADGDYYCNITIDSCTYMSNTIALTVLNSPIVVLNPNPEAYLCSLTDSVLLVGSAGGNSQWYMNGVLMAGETNDSIYVSAYGLYNMEKTNMNGCSDSANVGTTVMAPPALTIDPSVPSVYCTGDSLLLVATNLGGSYTWYLDGISVGVDNDSIYVNVAGTYSVACDFQSCTDSSAIGTVVTEDPCDIGYDEFATKLALEVYPNPAEREILLTYSVASENELIIMELIGMDGKVLVRETLPAKSNSKRVDVSEFNSGVYFIRMSAADSVVTKKFVKM